MRQWRWVLGAILAIMLTSPPAHAASAPEIFQKHNLIGIFAWDCGKPASESNLYFVNRVLDASRIQRDQMSGPTSSTRT
jgi:hypothetical protein